MTIAISLKVNDGVVLAADSATALLQRDPKGRVAVANIYDNANKIFNLRKEVPIGAITWGSGSIGKESISTLAKDFRQQIEEYVRPDGDYTVEDVATRFFEFVYAKYGEAFQKWNPKPDLGFMVVGYSSQQPLAEEWMIEIREGECNGPVPARRPEESGMTWNGEPEAIHRLFLGYSMQLPTALRAAGLDEDTLQKVLAKCQEMLPVPFVPPPMPIQDAINMARFFVETTVNFSKYSPGAPTVGGPVEVAAITRHEGFKWVQRKHYYSSELNPPEGRSYE